LNLIGEGSQYLMLGISCCSSLGTSRSVQPPNLMHSATKQIVWQHVFFSSIFNLASHELSFLPFPPHHGFLFFSQLSSLPPHSCNLCVLPNHHPFLYVGFLLCAKFPLSLFFFFAFIMSYFFFRLHFHFIFLLFLGVSK